MGMDEKQTLHRKIELKKQALRLIRKERDDLKHQVSLLNLRTFLEKHMGNDFDSALSLQLDAIQFLIDSLAVLQGEALSGRN
jgi:hypothetical protein